ncbi:MAG TPA: hypothetical protein VG939_17640 [Caulobacteraceae bacterium]|nr:hypothetical protein [Caulobacteraceae bacterium]
MTSRSTTVQRAYELARSGECEGIADIKRILEAEGRDDIAGQLFGPTIGAALRRLCVAARAP